MSLSRLALLFRHCVVVSCNWGVLDKNMFLFCKVGVLA